MGHDLPAARHHMDGVGLAQNGIALAAGAVITKMPRIVVDTQEVERSGDGLHIARLDRGHGIAVVVPRLLGIAAPNHRVYKPEVKAGMVEASELLVGLT